jgi:hypothetical protein
MKRRDWKIIFTALAFVAVVGKTKKTNSAELREQVLQFAGLIEEFCAAHVINVSAVVSDEAGALVVDDIIERHVRELREREETRLPDDRQTLIKLLDRLQHRKARRTQRMFFGSATAARLADMVLKLLDEEIADDSRARLA